ncbi:hypothetical protein BDR26DRAFT_858292 [Obelidium mucronatum]|nr:hypothetical protein BDR26DRAFT_858292 [Obelidium mucronatum]
MPVGLEGLISNQVYASRLQKLNEGFKTLSVPMDLGPMIRLASLIVLLGASAGLMTIADDITVQVFVCIAALSFQVAVNILTFRPKKFEVFINDQLKVFNQEDETIKLIWKLNSTVNEMRNVFYFKPIPYARSVLVRHTNKGGVEEFLPAYTERFDLMNWFVAAGSTAEGTGGAASPAVVPRVPSYRSMA